MKYILILSVLMFSADWSFAENEKTQRIFDAWLEMHNTGTEKAVGEFINDYYSTTALKKMKNFDAHVRFYMTMINDFGDLQAVIYKTEESSANRLKVQLLKKGSLVYPEPSPEEILVVEIDLDPSDSDFLEKGLGMGALICYIKR
jgi:hypothetical protein